jgi:hypothetical protein
LAHGMSGRGKLFFVCWYSCILYTKVQISQKVVSWSIKMTRHGIFDFKTNLPFFNKKLYLLYHLMYLFGYTVTLWVNLPCQFV